MKHYVCEKSKLSKDFDIIPAFEQNYSIRCSIRQFAETLNDKTRQK